MLPLSKEQIAALGLELATRKQEHADLDEAIELANGHGYGLSSAIYTRNPEWVWRFRQGVSAGMMSVNNSTSGAEAHLHPWPLLRHRCDPSSGSGALPQACECKRQKLNRMVRMVCFITRGFAWPSGSATTSAAVERTVM